MAQQQFIRWFVVVKVSLNWEITIGTSSGSYLSAQNTKSTTMPTKTTTTAMITTTTTMATTLPDRATLYHIQVSISYLDGINLLRQLIIKPNR